MSRLSDKNIATQEELGIAPLNTHFLPKEFRTAIESHGYEVVYEKALQCPCKEKDSSHRVTCNNCGGSGFLFVNPLLTKMILTSIDIEQEYGEDGMPLRDLGMLNATPVSLLKLGRFDRITILDGETSHSQVLFPFENEDTGQYIARTHYDIKQVEWVGLYESDNALIKRLSLNVDYVYSNNIILLDGKYNTLVDPQISVRYTHCPQFHVVDIVNEIRSVKTLDSGNSVNNYMPMKAQVKRAHLILDVENVDGNRLLDNSWIMSNCTTEEGLTKQAQILRYASVVDIFNNLTALQRVQLKAVLNGRLPDTIPLTITTLAPSVVIV